MNYSDPLTPSPSTKSAPLPTQPAAPTTPMAGQTTPSTELPNLKRVLSAPVNIPVYDPLKPAKEMDSMEVKFIEESNVDPKDSVVERIHLEPVAIKPGAVKVHPMLEDFVKPHEVATTPITEAIVTTTTTPELITTTLETIEESLKDRILGFFNKVGAAVRCSKRDCSEALKAIPLIKRRLTDLSTPPRRIREIRTGSKICSCQIDQLYNLNN